MAADLNFAIEVVGCPTLRASDGLAMSSRNAHLSAAERAQAASISRALFQARDAVAVGNTDAKKIVKRARNALVGAGIHLIDYVEVVDAQTLSPLEKIDRPARLCVAARVGSTRLIDNVALEDSA